MSETSSHLLSLGALPPCSPERQEEPQTLVLLQHHHNPHQGHQSSGEDYDDAEEVPVPGAPPASQVREEEVLPVKKDGMRSQTGEWG